MVQLCIQIHIHDWKKTVIGMSESQRGHLTRFTWRKYLISSSMVVSPSRRVPFAPFFFFLSFLTSAWYGLCVISSATEQVGSSEVWKPQPTSRSIGTWEWEPSPVKLCRNSLPWSVRAAIADHQRVGTKQQAFGLYSSEGWKSKVKVPARLGSWWGPSFWFTGDSLLLSSSRRAEG